MSDSSSIVFHTAAGLPLALSVDEYRLALLWLADFGGGQTLRPFGLGERFAGFLLHFGGGETLGQHTATSLLTRITCSASSARSPHGPRAYCSPRRHRYSLTRSRPGICLMP